tara:strand:- start:2503 stop:3516 length:1014 start_codon:yes stop_codon:yes gene_type:complete
MLKCSNLKEGSGNNESKNNILKYTEKWPRSKNGSLKSVTQIAMAMSMSSYPRSDTFSENDFREIIDSFRDFRYDLRNVQYELSDNSSSITKINGLIHDMIFLLHSKTLMFDKFKKWEDMNIERKKFISDSIINSIKPEKDLSTDEYIEERYRKIINQLNIEPSSKTELNDDDISFIKKLEDSKKNEIIENFHKQSKSSSYLIHNMNKNVDKLIYTNFKQLPVEVNEIINSYCIEKCKYCQTSTTNFNFCSPKCFNDCHQELKSSVLVNKLKETIESNNNVLNQRKIYINQLCCVIFIFVWKNFLTMDLYKFSFDLFIVCCNLIIYKCLLYKIPIISP